MIHDSTNLAASGARGVRSPSDRRRSWRTDAYRWQYRARPALHA